MVTEPTRENNRIDLVIATQDDLVSKVTVKKTTVLAIINNASRYYISNNSERKQIEDAPFQKCKFVEIRQNITEIQLSDDDNVEEAWVDKIIYSTEHICPIVREAM